MPGPVLSTVRKQKCARQGPVFKMGVSVDRGEERNSPANIAWACGMVYRGESGETLPRPCAGPQGTALPGELLPDSPSPPTPALPALPPKHVSRIPNHPSVLVLACHLLPGWHATSPAPTHLLNSVKVIILQPIVFLTPSPIKCLGGSL